MPKVWGWEQNKAKQTRPRKAIKKKNRQNIMSQKSSKDL